MLQQARLDRRTDQRFSALPGLLKIGTVGIAGADPAGQLRQVPHRHTVRVQQHGAGGKRYRQRIAIAQKRLCIAALMQARRLDPLGNRLQRLDAIMDLLADHLGRYLRHRRLLGQHKSFLALIKIVAGQEVAAPDE